MVVTLYWRSPLESAGTDMGLSVSVTDNSLNAAPANIAENLVSIAGQKAGESMQIPSL